MGNRKKDTALQERLEIAKTEFAGSDWCSPLAEKGFLAGWKAAVEVFDDQLIERATLNSLETELLKAQERLSRIEDERVQMRGLRRLHGETEENRYRLGVFEVEARALRRRLNNMGDAIAGVHSRLNSAKAAGVGHDDRIAALGDRLAELRESIEQIDGRVLRTRAFDEYLSQLAFNVVSAKEALEAHDYDRVRELLRLIANPSEDEYLIWAEFYELAKGYRPGRGGAKEQSYTKAESSLGDQ